MTALSPDPTGPDSTPDEPGPDDTSRFRSGPGFFPGVVVPAWVILHPDVDEGALAVATFIAAYRSSADDRMPFVGRKTIARRFTRSTDWVDARTRVLCEIGYLTKVPVYRDALTGERTLDPVAADGSLNSQSTNDWVFADAPPAGDRHPHPVMSAEFDHPDRVRKRIADRARTAAAIAKGGAAHQRPGSEQGEHQKTAGRTPAAHQRPGGPLHSGRGGRSTAALTETKENGDQTNQPRAAASAVDVTPGTGSGGLVGGEDEGTDKAAAVLASLPVRTPLPASTVTALAPHVASLLASGWTAGELTEHLTAGLPPSYGAGLIVQRVRDTRPRTTTAEIMARQRAEAAAIRDCRLCDGAGFRYHPEGRHHGPTSERCNHQPVNGSDAPSASGNTCAEGAAPSATRDGAAETTLTVEQARLMIRQILARSKSKSASHATMPEGQLAHAVTRSL